MTFHLLSAHRPRPEMGSVLKEKNGCQRHFVKPFSDGSNDFDNVTSPESAVNENSRLSFY